MTLFTDANNQYSVFCKTGSLIIPQFIKISKNSLFNAVDFSPSLKMTILRNKKKLVAINKDNHVDYPRYKSNGTGMFLVRRRILLLRYRRKKKVRWQRNCLASSVGQSFAFWAPYQNQMTFSEPTKPVSLRTGSGDNPEFKERKPGKNGYRCRNDPHPEMDVALSQSTQEFRPNEVSFSFLGIFWEC